MLEKTCLIPLAACCALTVIKALVLPSMSMSFVILPLTIYGGFVIGAGIFLLCTYITEKIKESLQAKREKKQKVSVAEPKSTQEELNYLTSVYPCEESGRYFFVDEVAKLCGVSTCTVHNRIKDGTIEGCYKVIGKHRRVLIHEKYISKISVRQSGAPKKADKVRQEDIDNALKSHMDLI